MFHPLYLHTYHTLGSDKKDPLCLLQNDVIVLPSWWGIWQGAELQLLIRSLLCDASIRLLLGHLL